MRDTSGVDESPSPANRPLGRAMARGTAAQQGGTVAAVLVGLLTTTILGRSLTLSEFGVYGFVVALASYLYFVAGTVETAAINEMASADTRRGRDAAFTRSIVVYAVLGTAAGLVIAAGGALLVAVLDVPSALLTQARIGAAAVGVLTALGWIGKVFQDLLRAAHRFSSAAACEALGSVMQGTAVMVAVIFDAPLWCIIAVGSAIPLYVGAAATVMVTRQRVEWTLRVDEVNRHDLRRFLSYSGGLFVIAATDVVISSLDRLVVGALRSASTLGLYEAAIRMNLLIRAWLANFSVTLLPVLSSLRAGGEDHKERDLLVLGTRYVLPAVVGPTVTLMVLSDRVLDVWLGERFVAAAPTAAVFLAWWLIAPNLTIAQSMLVVERRLRPLAISGWAAALTNLIVSVALTAWLGLIGVAIGTTVGFLVVLPYSASVGFKGRGVRVATFARQVWAPAYGLAVALALLLLAVRASVPLEEAWAVVLACTGGVAAYWLSVYAIAFTPAERAFFRGLVARR